MLAKQRAIAAAARRLSAEGLVIGSTGNVSVRDRDSFLITPTRRRYADMKPWEIVRYDSGRTAFGRRGKPSLEGGLHKAIYAARPDVGAVVHHHGPYATALSLWGGELEPRLEEAEYFAIGPVRVASPAPQGSPELASACVEALGASRAVLLAGHGMVAVAPTLAMALDISIAVEHEAHVVWLTRATPPVSASPRPRLPGELTARTRPRQAHAR